MAVVDNQINKRLRFGYDVGKGYVVGEEEVQNFITHMIDNKRIATELRTKTMEGRTEILKSLGTYLSVIFLFGHVPTRSRRIEFSTPSSPVSCFFYRCSSTFVSVLMTSLQLGFGLRICRCPPTSIFHVLITTSSSLFLSTWPNHLPVHASHLIQFLGASRTRTATSLQFCRAVQEAC